MIQQPQEYRDLLEKRKLEYERCMYGVRVDPFFREWEAVMQARHGEVVQVWHGRYSSWLVALMIVRYGEAVKDWPKALSENDKKRAALWTNGGTPKGVSYPLSPGAGRVAMLSIVAAMGILGYLMGYLQDWLAVLSMTPIMASALTDYMETQMVDGLYRTGHTTVGAWAASTAYAQGDIVRPTTYNDRFFECVVAGTSAATEPSWGTALGAETIDNTATWQAVALGVPKRGRYIAAFTAAPGESGGGTEVLGGAYARVAYHPLDANWTATSGGDGQTDNAIEITFPAPTANWGVVSHMGTYNRSVGGNLQDYAVLTTAKTVNNGDPSPKFAVGALTATWA